MKTAIVIGATGLVGKELVKRLLTDPYFVKVKIFTRRGSGLTHDKLEEYIIDFEQADRWRDLVRGDVLFSTLGSTIKQAGSKLAQYKIDFTYQYQFAQIASKNGITSYVLVSAIGANPKATFFYNRMKGELEEAVKALPFESIHILRPSVLVGNRQKNRIGEKIASSLLILLNSLGFFKAYRPVSAESVAQSLINASKLPLRGLQIQEAGIL